MDPSIRYSTVKIAKNMPCALIQGAKYKIIKESINVLLYTTFSCNVTFIFQAFL
jgi:hypothetical protein